MKSSGPSRASVVRFVRRGAVCSAPLLLFLWALDAWVRQGLRLCTRELACKVQVALQHVEDPRIAVFGASNALTGVDAARIERRTGASTFNFALNGTFFFQNQIVVRDFLASTKRARCVILCETNYPFSRWSAIANPVTYLPFLDRPVVYERLHDIEPELVWRARYVPFYALVIADVETYRLALRGHARAWAPWQLPPDRLRQGFLPTPGSRDRPVAALTPDVAFDPRLVDDFRDVLDEARLRGLRAFVLLTPLRPGCAAPGLPDLQRRLQELADATGARLLDHSSDDLVDDASAFYDCGHLNEVGAARLSDRLAAELGDSCK